MTSFARLDCFCKREKGAAASRGRFDGGCIDDVALDTSEARALDEVGILLLHLFARFRCQLLGRA